MKTKQKTNRRFFRSLKRTFRLGALLIFIPIIAGGATIYYVFNGDLMTAFANHGNSRLVTDGWQDAATAFDTTEPDYGPQFSYYKLQPGQDLTWASKHFSVSLAKLQQLNPGQNLPGTTIAVPPVEQPLAPFAASAATSTGIVVTETQGTVYVENAFTNKEAYVTIPQLMTLLQPHAAISQLGAKDFVINKPLYIQDNIRVDVTSDTVNTLYLRSDANFDITTLTFQNSEALFQGVNVTTLDTTTNKPDSNFTDGRSFLRAYQNGRMDVIDSNTSYLGMTLAQIQTPAIRAKVPFVSQGGVYGVAWRIGSGTYGSDIATGWVEKSTFEHNYIGAFTFGASGMMWKNNLFTLNTIYGLDPHDDSNNATIEDNRFVANGKHGFIVSKRCDHNVIKDNISIDNAFHGFMLHDDSNYNIIENNISIGNVDNFVIYDSNFNKITGNRSYNPRGSNVRINQPSVENYVTNNTFYGGKKGIYLYDGVNGVDISGNTFFNVTNMLTTRKATAVLYNDNSSNSIGYQVPDTDRVVFGINHLNKKPAIDLKPLQTIEDGKAKGQSLPVLALQARGE